MALGSLVYKFEEKDKTDKYYKDRVEKQLYNPSAYGDLISLKGPDFNLVKKGKNFYSNKTGALIEEAKMEYLFSILSGIELERRLDPLELKKTVSRNKFFPDLNQFLEFKFTKGEIRFLLGDKINTSRDFYFEIKSRLENNPPKIDWVVASDTSAETGIYEKDGYETSDQKYIRLKSLILLKDDFFYDTRLFTKIIPEVKIIKIGGNRNPEFTLDFEDFSTGPKNFSNLGHNKNKFKIFLKKINQIRAESIIYPIDSAKLGKKVSFIEIKFQNYAHHMVFELFNSYAGKNGYFIKSSDRAELLQITKEFSKPFFAHHQDFWKKNLKEVFEQVQEKQISVFSPSKTEVKFDIENFLDFKNSKSGNKQIDILVQVVNSNAERIENFIRPGKNTKNSYKLKMNDDLEFELLTLKDDYLLVNEKNGYGLHYPKKEIDKKLALLNKAIIK